MNLRVALVGFGKMGILHSAILSSMPNVRLVAVCEASRFSRQLASRILNGVSVLSDLRMMGDLDLNAVYVTTPPSSHSAIVKTIVEGQISPSLFVEKPLGISYADSLESSSLALRLRVAMVGYQRRFAVTFKKGKELLDGHFIGEPREFRGYAFSSDVLTGKRGWRFSKPAGGGVLRDLGPHLVDILLWYFGGFQVVSSVRRSIYSYGVEDFAAFSLTTKNEVKGYAEMSWSNPNYRLPEVGLAIEGTLGSLFVTDDFVRMKSKEGSRVWYRQDLGDQVDYLLGQAEFTRESEHFASCIDRGMQPATDFKTAAEVDSILDVVYGKTSVGCT